jgi:sucrose phosphorylase
MILQEKISLSSKRYFFSALGEREKVTLARAIHMFMPEYQVWYLDVLRENNYEAADNGGSAGHKEN